MKQIVISGINLFSGGTLTIFKDMLRSLVINDVQKQYEVVCFVHKKALFAEFIDNVKIIEVPESRNSYFIRLKYEYFVFKRYSKRHDIFIWISAQDITPNVKAEKLFTYCHNPMMFYKIDSKEIRYAKKLALFTLFYKYLYGINIKNNTYVIVQQDWIRKRFQREYGINNVLVARPKFDGRCIEDCSLRDPKRFIYASQATFFKNFDIICEAAQILELSGISDFKITITIDGTENQYSKDLFNKYKHLSTITWAGFQSKEDLYTLYSVCNCLIFPSKLETWGLPISEFKESGKPIMLANLPYAYESIGDYTDVCFFDPDNPKELAELLRRYIKGENIFKSVKAKTVDTPYVNNWDEFWRFVMTC